MARYINADKFLDKLLYMGYMDEQKSEVEEVANNMIEEAIPKADYENRLKADMVAMLKEIQDEIFKESWRLECICDDLDGSAVDLDDINKIIQQKINKIKGQN